MQCLCRFVCWLLLQQRQQQQGFMQPGWFAGMNGQLSRLLGRVIERQATWAGAYLV
jgi:hypothetical protein